MREGLFHVQSHPDRRDPAQQENTNMNEQNPTEQTIGGDPAEDATSSYDIDAIQDKWQKIWTDLDPFKVRDDDSAERLSNAMS